MNFVSNLIRAKLGHSWFQTIGCGFRLYLHFGLMRWWPRFHFCLSRYMFVRCCTICLCVCIIYQTRKYWNIYHTKEGSDRKGRKVFWFIKAGNVQRAMFIGRVKLYSQQKNWYFESTFSALRRRYKDGFHSRISSSEPDQTGEFFLSECSQLNLIGLRWSFTKKLRFIPFWKI